MKKERRKTEFKDKGYEFQKFDVQVDFFGDEGHDHEFQGYNTHDAGYVPRHGTSQLRPPCSYGKFLDNFKFNKPFLLEKL